MYKRKLHKEQPKITKEDIQLMIPRNIVESDFNEDDCINYLMEAEK